MDIRYESMNYDDNFLMHHGIKGMKWGTRRYQYEDGRWTPAGKARRKDREDAYAKYARKATSSGGNSRRKLNKQLKKLSKRNERASNDLLREERDVRKWQKKYDRVERKVNRKGDNASNRLLRKYEKRKQRLAGEKNDVSAVKADLKRNAQTRNKIIQAAVRKGFTVNTKKTQKLGNERKRLAYAYFFGSKGAAYSQLKYGNTKINASRSKVVKTKTGEKARHNVTKRDGVARSYAKIAAMGLYSDTVRAMNRAARKHGQNVAAVNAVKRKRHRRVS